MTGYSTPKLVAVLAASVLWSADVAPSPPVQTVHAWYEATTPLSQFHNDYPRVAHVRLLQAHLIRTDESHHTADVFVEEERAMAPGNTPATAWYTGTIRLTGTGGIWKVTGISFQPEDVSGLGGHRTGRSDPALVAQSVEANSTLCPSQPAADGSTFREIEVCGRERHHVSLALLHDGEWTIVDVRPRALRIQIGSPVNAAKMLHQVRPVYPPEARRQHIEGTVRLLLTISKTGEPTDIQVESGHPLLIPAALDAVKQWRYEPTHLNGEPVEVRTTVDVPFTLSQ